MTQMSTTTLYTDDARPHLTHIVRLKQQFWRYPETSQIEWFGRNVSPDDWHVLGMDEANKLIGYAHIRVHRTSPQLTAIVNTVCVDKNLHRRGFGRTLMTSVNAGIRINGWHGYLSCAASNVGFYEKVGWRISDGPDQYRRSANELVLSYYVKVASN